jgi:hypothetical protein
MFVPHTHTHTPSVKKTEKHRPILHVVTSRTAGHVRSLASPQLRLYFVRNVGDAVANTEFVTHASEINK